MWRVVVCLVLGLLLVGTDVPRPAAQEHAAQFRRGASIHTMMNWAALELGDSLRYAWPPFEGPDYEISDRLLHTVANAGFDFIRLTVDPGPFLQFDGDRRQELDRKLLATVRRLMSHGFAVIVDFHPNSQVATYAPARLVESLENPLFLDYVRMVRRTARLLAGLKSHRIALEPMNEPATGWDRTTAARWQQMLERFYREVRAETPDLLLVLTGARGGNAKGLLAVDPRPFADSRVRFSFHYYLPYEFTHQGVKSNSEPEMQFLSGVPYPPETSSFETVWPRIQENVFAAKHPDAPATTIAQAKAKLLNYFAAGFDRKRIAADFDLVRRWAHDNGVDPQAIILGEFGATRTYGRYRAADAASREAWLRDVRSEAERCGFAWAVWVVSGYGGMALVSSDGSDTLDPGSIRALGLGRPGPR